MTIMALLPRCWVIFFNPNAGFSLLGYFKAGLFFLPNRCVEIVSGETCAATESTGFLSPQERAVLRTAADVVHSFGEIKVPLQELVLL